MRADLANEYGGFSEKFNVKKGGVYTPNQKELSKKKKPPQNFPHKKNKKFHRYFLFIIFGQRLKVKPGVNFPHLLPEILNKGGLEFFNLGFPPLKWETKSK